MMNEWKQRIKQLWVEEDGIGTLEVILIVAVIVVIAVAFRKWIIQWVNKLFEDSNDKLRDTEYNPEVIVPNAQ